jgi:drug/metabolite transporter (DMT)-like permease
VAVTGIFFALATLSLFTALALGPISIVAPMTGSYPAFAMLSRSPKARGRASCNGLAIAAVMTGVLIVSCSGGRSEESGALARGALKGVLGLAFLAGFCSAVALTAGQAAVPTFGEVETVWLARSSDS